MLLKEGSRFGIQQNGIMYKKRPIDRKYSGTKPFGWEGHAMCLKLTGDNKVVFIITYAALLYTSSFKNTSKGRTWPYTIYIQGGEAALSG